MPTTKITDEQRETLNQIRTQAEALAALLDQLGATGSDFSEAKDAVLDLRDEAQRLSEAPEA